MLDFGTFVLKARTYSPGLRQRRHSHEHNNITIITNGQIDEAAADGQYCGGPSSVVLKAAGCEHETRISGYGARTLTIEFGASSPFAASIPARTWWWTEDAAIVRRALALQQAFRRGVPMELEEMSNDLVATVIAAHEARTTGAPSWISAMKTMLEEHFQDPLRFEELARDMGLHPVYVSRAFHHHAGVSMTDYVRALRLRRARQLLSSSRRSIAAIAAEAGFADSSHLCRTFSDLLEMTPKAYRRLFSRQV